MKNNFTEYINLINYLRYELLIQKGDIQNLSDQEKIDKLIYIYKTHKKYYSILHDNPEHYYYYVSLLSRYITKSEDICFPTSHYIFKLSNKINSLSLLDLIINASKEKIIKKYCSTTFNKKKYNDLCLQNCCFTVSKIVKSTCDKLNIPCKIIKINRGFAKEKEFPEDGFHYFNIVTIDQKDYIIDLSYNQFFLTKTNIIDRLGVVGLNGCDPGIFMMMDSSRKETALELLNNGYIEMTPNNIKNYFDGFAISYRNGLYYENLGYIDYSTNYTFEDYLRFINYEDEMGNHENSEYFKLQLTPLKNSEFIF